MTGTAQIGAFGAAARRGQVLLVDGLHDLGGMQGLGAVDHSRAEPVFRYRAVLAGMGCPLPEEAEIRSWDSSAEVCYLVLPQRPPRPRA